MTKVIFSLKKLQKNSPFFVCIIILMRYFFAGGDIPSEIKRSIVVRVEISREVLFLNS